MQGSRYVGRRGSGEPTVASFRPRRPHPTLAMWMNAEDAFVVAVVVGGFHLLYYPGNLVAFPAVTLHDMSIRRFLKPADAFPSPKRARPHNDSSSESDVEVSAVQFEEEVAQSSGAQSSDESEVELLSTADSLGKTLSSKQSFRSRKSSLSTSSKQSCDFVRSGVLVEWNSFDTTAKAKACFAFCVKSMTRPPIAHRGKVLHALDYGSRASSGMKNHRSIESASRWKCRANSQT